MRLRRLSPAAALLCAAVAEAAEYRHLDGIHRIEKKAEITEAAVLQKRQEDDSVCGTSMKLCPSSKDGGCCPDNYECGVSSCYATTKGPSTCGTKVGWYPCAREYGGGCCPDGLLCETGQNCVPPSGSPYTFGCPSSHYLCPSSMSYGCCPDGMGCAVNQCYSTEAQTIVETMTITTTEDGERTTYTTRSTSVSEPDIPTDLPEVDANDNDEQIQLKYFPSVVAKETPISDPEDDDGGGGGGLSQGELAGIITGAVAFLIIVIVAAFIVIRHLNKVVAAVGHSDQSGTSSSRTRPPMKQFRPTDSEVDHLSVDPLMMSPRAAAVPKMATSNTDALSSSDVTPSSFAGVYQAVSTVPSSRHQSWDSAGVTSYFDPALGNPNRVSAQSTIPNSTNMTNRVSGDSSGTYMHVRHWSNASEDSHEGEAAHNQDSTTAPRLFTELEATSVVPELPGSPTEAASPTDDHRRRSSGGQSISSVLSASGTDRAHQRMRSGTNRGVGDLSVVDEEMHGFHGPSDRMAGRTERPGSRGSWKTGDDCSISSK